MSSKVVVVDLDGTLLRTNTFHKWLIFLLKKSLLSHPLDSIKIGSIMILRISKFITHREMKYRILKISESKNYVEYIEEFVQALDAYLDQEVLSYIDGENIISILATAAPVLYAETIANKYNFNYCLATPNTLTVPWYENIKENKRKTLKDLLHSLDIEEVSTVLSDHHDDLPIMELAENIYLVNASSLTEEILLKHKVNYFKIPNIAS